MHSVKTLLQASADELEKLSFMTSHLQDMSTAITSAGINASGSKALQSLDYMSQSLSALKNVLNGAAQNAPEDLVLDHVPQISEVKLRALKLSLLGEVQTVFSEDIKLGECDLF